MPSAIEWKSWTAVKRSMIEVTGEVGTIDNYGRGSKRYDVTGGFCVYAIGLGLPGEALVYIPTRAEVDLTCFLVASFDFVEYFEPDEHCLLVQLQGHRLSHKGCRGQINEHRGRSEREVQVLVARRNGNRCLRCVESPENSLNSFTFRCKIDENRCFCGLCG